jgi:hypothetical protein
MTHDRRYYGISTIIGTVAVAYGSVPMYKMVRMDSRVEESKI